MVRSFMLILIVVASISAAVNAHSQDEAKADPAKSNVQVLMRDKLNHMQGVLGGLVTEDFDAVAKESGMLRMIGKAASWQALDTKEYRGFSERYAVLTKNLNKAALDEDRDAVLLQYLQLNISCVDCHRYMAEQK